MRLPFMLPTHWGSGCDGQQLSSTKDSWSPQVKAQDATSVGLGTWTNSPQETAQACRELLSSRPPTGPGAREQKQDGRRQRSTCHAVTSGLFLRRALADSGVGKPSAALDGSSAPWCRL